MPNDQRMDEMGMTGGSARMTERLGPHAPGHPVTEFLPVANSCPSWTRLLMLPDGVRERLLSGGWDDGSQG
jgi:hypothetical protein